MRTVSMRVRTRALIFLFSVHVAVGAGFTPAAHGQGNVLHVPSDFATVQQAIDYATAGDTVVIAAGRYQENITLRDGITLRGSGGGTATPDDRSDDSILDADFTGRTIVCNEVEDVTLTGLTIVNGRNHDGANVYISDSSVSIRNNLIADGRTNHSFSQGYGGGIYAQDATVTIEANRIVNNDAWGRGGGIYIDRCGGSVSRNRLVGNHADFGGGIFLFLTSVEVHNNVVDDNFTTFAGGGGIYLHSAGAHVFNNTIVNNRTPLLNEDRNRGGGIYIRGNAAPTLRNNIVYNNRAGHSGAGVFLEPTTPTPEMDYNDLFQNLIIGDVIANCGNCVPGSHSISAAPLFVDEGAGDYRLQLGSPAIDAGDPNPLFDDQDGTRNDMGVWGGIGFANLPTADFDDDGDVDGSDFLAWQQGFGTFADATPAAGDADDDQDVDGNDFLIWQQQFDSQRSNQTELSLAGAGANDSEAYLVVVDEHDRPLPREGWFYNSVGGDRGRTHGDDVSSSVYTRSTDSSYRGTLTAHGGLWGSHGMWYSLGGIDADNTAIDFAAILGPYILPAHQGEIVEVLIDIDQVSASRQDFEFHVELKNKAGGEICRRTWLNPPAMELRWTLPEHCKGQVAQIVWLADHVVVGDTIVIDSVKLKAHLPPLPTEEQAFLWSYTLLMANYDPVTGIVQDRRNFRVGSSENISATAKAAKNTYYAYLKGFVSRSVAEQIITTIAATLIGTVPRGPAGLNSLWPHFTRNGGAQAVPPRPPNPPFDPGDPGSEWATGDTFFAALDLIATLQMLGDPQRQIDALVSFLGDIQWQPLLIQNAISHGYEYDGTPKPYAWRGFGMETVGVNWVYKAVTGHVGDMDQPPSDNGSGFIDNAQYPIVLSGTDLWGNDWDAYRGNMADAQINWYAQASHENPFLADAGLFGLSAAENPDDGGYIAYGVGGQFSAFEDGDSEVVALHYAGMIADIRPMAAKRMWEVLRDRDAPFLTSAGKVIISPLNNMESMRVDKQTGAVTVHHLRGSWNLALQAEGWAMADPTVRQALAEAIEQNAFLRRGLETSGDFDLDGDVDGNDFLIWQRGFGANEGAARTDGDSDGDGDVDGDDFLGWQRDFGQTAGSESASGATASSDAMVPARDHESNRKAKVGKKIKRLPTYDERRSKRRDRQTRAKSGRLDKEQNKTQNKQLKKKRK